MSEEPLLTKRENGVLELTLNRPDALNSMTEELHLKLQDAISQVESDETIRAVILTGAGRAFCAGQDLSGRRQTIDGEPPDLGHSLETYYNPLIRRLYALRVPTIAAVNGVAAGAGANIALACDLVFAAKSAKFIQAFCKIGLGPDSGGSYFLPRAVGLAKAKGLALTGEAVSAEDAERLGMIWQVVDDTALMETARAQAAKFADGPPLGLAAIRHVLHQSLSNDLDAQLDLERDTQRELGRSNDYREGVLAFFEKRTPKFTGR